MSQFFSRLKISEIGAGYCHFPDNRSDEYFKQLASSEKIVTKFHKGFPRREFVKTRTRNEALDCRVYAIGALSILNLNLNVISERVAREKDNVENKAKVRPNRPQNISGRNFIHNWRQTRCSKKTFFLV